MILNNMRQMQYNIKFLVDLYLNIGNTSLSVGAVAFKEILANKFEINYGQQNNMATPMGGTQTGGILKT